MTSIVDTAILSSFFQISTIRKKRSIPNSRDLSKFSRISVSPKDASPSNSSLLPQSPKFFTIKSNRERMARDSNRLPRCRSSLKISTGQKPWMRPMPSY